MGLAWHDGKCEQWWFFFHLKKLVPYPTAATMNKKKERTHKEKTGRNTLDPKKMLPGPKSTLQPQVCLNPMLGAVLHLTLQSHDWYKNWFSIP